MLKIPQSFPRVLTALRVNTLNNPPTQSASVSASASSSSRRHLRRHFVVYFAYRADLSAIGVLAAVEVWRRRVATCVAMASPARTFARPP